MVGTPEGMEISDVIASMEKMEGVSNVHHVHIWQLDEHRNALEAHVVLPDTEKLEDVKARLITILHDDFSIEHSTLEFEFYRCCEIKHD